MRWCVRVRVRSQLNLCCWSGVQQYQQLYREWEPVLAQLKQMGFEDPRRNIDLILAHRGSMVDVVEQLLNRKS